LNRTISVQSRLLAGLSGELGAVAENSFSGRKPDKMRALSATHTLMELQHVGYRTTR
jgi:hypothetical protein